MLATSRERFRGFLTPLEKRYLEFLRYDVSNEIEHDNRKDWNKEAMESMPYRSLDYQIRWKTRKALEDLRLVFEKFGATYLHSLFADAEAINNLRFLIERVNLFQIERAMRRLERERR